MPGRLDEVHRSQGSLGFGLVGDVEAGAHVTFPVELDNA
jgi:hypothetical protein